MKKILLVDDEVYVRELLEATIARKGYQILQASTGQDAAEICAQNKPDLILMDIFMPGELSGIEATRLLKSDVETRESKVIILTSSIGAKHEALNAGADGYLVKPFSPLELLRKIDGFLNENLLSDPSEQTESIG